MSKYRIPCITIGVCAYLDTVYWRLYCTWQNSIFNFKNSFSIL